MSKKALSLEGTCPADLAGANVAREIGAQFGQEVTIKIDGTRCHIAGFVEERTIEQIRDHLARVGIQFKA